jgi:uncharacterized protein YkwD
MTHPLVRLALLLALTAATASEAAAPQPLAPEAVPRAPPAPVTGTAQDRQGDWALQAANAARATHGLPPLHLDPALTVAAQQHAADMAWHGYLAHTSPEGGTPLARYLKAGGDPAKLVGENIAHCPSCYNAVTQGTIQQLTQDWMNSPEHRKNLLAPEFDSFGFGTAIDDELGLYAVQTFAGAGRSLGDAAALATPLRTATEQTQHAVELLAKRRASAKSRGVKGDDALVTAAQANLAQPSAGLRLPDLGTVLHTVSDERPGRWRRLSAIGAECSGCGPEPTSADVGYFLDQWLADRQYRQQLLDPALTHIGLAVRADGQGRKVALLLLGTGEGG